MAEVMQITVQSIEKGSKHRQQKGEALKANPMACKGKFNVNV